MKVTLVNNNSKRQSFGFESLNFRTGAFNELKKYCPELRTKLDNLYFFQPIRCEDVHLDVSMEAGQNLRKFIFSAGDKIQEELVLRQDSAPISFETLKKSLGNLITKVDNSR